MVLFGGGCGRPLVVGRRFLCLSAPSGAEGLANVCEQRLAGTSSRPRTELVAWRLDWGSSPSCRRAAVEVEEDRGEQRLIEPVPEQAVHVPGAELLEARCIR